jgi:hypothetical protein
MKKVSFSRFHIYFFFKTSTQRLALAAGRTGETLSQTSTIASKPAPYHQGEALSAARFVGTLLTCKTHCQKNNANH